MQYTLLRVWSDFVAHLMFQSFGYFKNGLGVDSEYLSSVWSILLHIRGAYNFLKGEKYQDEIVEVQQKHAHRIHLHHSLPR